jgi:transmembrane sensor
MSDLSEHVRSVAEQVDAGYDAERTATALERLHAGLRRRRARRVLYGSLAGALCVLAVVFYSLRPPREVAKLSVPPQAEVLFSLSDGSTVTAMDRGGRVVTRSVSPHRVELDLVAGSAQFEVTPDQEREFRVNAGRVAVVVLGTKFAVSLREDHTRIEVQRGRVCVDWERGQQILAQGERGIFPPVEAQTGLPAGPGSDGEIEKPLAPPPPVFARAGADWRTLARRGDFTSAYRMVHARPALLTEMDDLLLAADVVRGAGHAGEAVAFLEKAIALHNSDSRSAVAAFTLGRVRQTDLDDPAGAAAAFARARAIAPDGPLAEDSLAREVESSFQAGDKIRARALAEEYVKTWPSGTRLRAVRHFGGLP